MNAREAILNKVRAALHASPDDPARRKAVEERIARAPAGVIPQRGQLPRNERIKLFCKMAEGLFATVVRLKSHDDVPKAVMSYLRRKNLPSSIRIGTDPALAAMDWSALRTLEVRTGASDGNDLAGVSNAFAAVAETGTLIMLSGPDNPTTINFLPEHHIVVVDAAAVEGDLEAALACVRERFGKGALPRTVNLVSGPSRSGDIEQKLVLGAHGPRALHILLVGQ